MKEDGIEGAYVIYKLRYRYVQPQNIFESR